MANPSESSAPSEKSETPKSSTSEHQRAVSVPRILQYQGQRYSLRIEDVFWNEFARAARSRGLREAELMARLARGGEGSLSSRVRTFCMAEALRLRTVADAGGDGALFAALDHAPLPALLVSNDGTVLFQNRSLQSWLGDDRDHTGERLSDLFSVRASLAWPALTEEVRRRSPEPLKVHVVRIAKGKTLAAMALLTALSKEGGHGDSRNCCMIWLNSGQPARAVTTPNND